MMKRRWNLFGLVMKCRRRLGVAAAFLMFDVYRFCSVQQILLMQQRFCHVGVLWNVFLVRLL
ncbi:hypothetical protein Plhal304r1_c014g0052811 [Plasmopara halstedii]